MAGQDVTKVRVALSGNVWVADTGSTVPTDITVAPNASWTDLGYTTEDGITFSLEQQTQDINGWQSLEPLRVIVTAEPKQFNFTLRQMEKATWTTTFGGSVTQAPVATNGLQAQQSILLDAGYVYYSNTTSGIGKAQK